MSFLTKSLKMVLTFSFAKKIRASMVTKMGLKTGIFICIHRVHIVNSYKICGQPRYILFIFLIFVIIIYYLFD